MVNQKVSISVPRVRDVVADNMLVVYSFAVPVQSDGIILKNPYRLKKGEEKKKIEKKYA